MDSSSCHHYWIQSATVPRAPRVTMLIERSCSVDCIALVHHLLPRVSPYRRHRPPNVGDPEELKSDATLPVEIPKANESTTTSSFFETTISTFSDVRSDEPPRIIPDDLCCFRLNTLCLSSAGPTVLKQSQWDLMLSTSRRGQRCYTSSPEPQQSTKAAIGRRFHLQRRDELWGGSSTPSPPVLNINTTRESPTSFPWSRHPNCPIGAPCRHRQSNEPITVLLILDLDCHHSLLLRPLSLNPGKIAVPLTTLYSFLPLRFLQTNPSDAAHRGRDAVAVCTCEEEGELLIHWLLLFSFLSLIHAGDDNINGLGLELCKLMFDSD